MGLLTNGPSDKKVVTYCSTYKTAIGPVRLFVPFVVAGHISYSPNLINVILYYTCNTPLAYIYSEWVCAQVQKHSTKQFSNSDRIKTRKQWKTVPIIFIHFRWTDGMSELIILNKPRYDKNVNRKIKNQNAKKTILKRIQWHNGYT